MNCKLMLSALLFIPFASILAEESATNGIGIYQECIDSHSTNYEWADCGRAEIKRQQGLMVAQFKRTKEALMSDRNSQSKVQILENEQRQWNLELKSACEELRNMELGRESAVLDYPMCKANMIERRIEELRRAAG